MSVWDNITSAWLGNESSGNMADAVGGLTLTDNGSIGSAAGLVYPLTRDFESGSSQFGSRASSTGTQAGSVFLSIAAFIKMESKPGAADMSIVSKDDILGNREYNLGWGRIADRFAFETYRSLAGADQVIVTANTFGAPSTGTNYLLGAVFDNLADKIKISINGGDFDEAAQTGIIQSNSVFRIGAQNVGSNINFFDGTIGPVYFSNTTAFTQEELVYLWNSGAGRQLGTPVTYNFNTDGEYLFDTTGRVNFAATILAGAQQIIIKIPSISFFTDDAQDGMIRINIASNSESIQIKNQNDIGLFITSGGSVSSDDGSWVISESTVGGNNWGVNLSWDGPAYTPPSTSNAPISHGVAFPVTGDNANFLYNFQRENLL